MLIHRVAYAIVAGASCVHIVQEYLGELILVSQAKFMKRDKIMTN